MFCIGKGTFLDGSLVLGIDVPVKILILKEASLKHTFSKPLDSINNCDRFIDFVIHEDDTSLKSGQVYVLHVLGEHRLDLLTTKTSEEKLPKKDVSIELSNNDVIEEICKRCYYLIENYME